MTTLIYLSSSPYDNGSLKEALDLALVFGTFEQAISLCITGDALALLISEQVPTARHGKHLYKLLDGLEFYDIENIYVRQSEVSALPINIWQGTQSLDDDQWIDMINNHTHIYHF